MSLYFYYFLKSFRYCLEIAVAVFLFAPLAKRKKNYPVKTGICLLAEIVVCALLTIPMVLIEEAERTDLYSIYRFLLYSVMYTLMYLTIIIWLLISYKDKVLNIFFYFLCGHALRSSLVKIFSVIVQAISMSGATSAELDTDSPLMIAVYYILLIAVYAVAYFLLGRRLQRAGDYMKITYRAIPVYVVIILLTASLSYVERWLVDSDGLGYILVMLTGAIFNFLIILIQVIIVEESRSSADKIVIEKIFEEDRRQYDLLKENMDVINLKCHDLRHQIAALQTDAGGVDKNYLDELAGAISIYDSALDTGNEALNVVLMSKKLVCENADIQFICIADGKLLSFLEVPDIYSLFGNVLENAIEYEKTIQEKEKRFINLSVQLSRGMIIVHCENYFEGQVVWRADGLPQSGKTDKSYHGFGSKSIRNIAIKYGGMCKFFVQDSMFQTDICFPQE